MLGTGMLIFGIFAATSVASRALAIPSYPVAARIAQVLSYASIALFIWPYVSTALRIGGR